MIIYLLSLFAVIIGVSFIVGLVDMFSGRDNWQNKVTAEDLRELGRLFEREDAFVDYNDKGEKFFVGYPKN